jgi:hypothetical protein
MENYKINNKIKHPLDLKKYTLILALFVCMFSFCQTGYSTSMNITPATLSVDVQSKGTATVKILDDEKNPLYNIPVFAKSDSEVIATVTPALAFTNTAGKVSFSITGISNGTSTITFFSNTLTKAIPVTIVSNIASCAVASSSGGGTDDFGPETMNDGIEKEDCSYHWIRTSKNGRKKTGWIQLDWNKEVTVTRMTIQTTDCNESCGEISADPFYVDPGRNLGNGLVQYLDEDGVTWITDDEFIEEIGDVEYSFTKPITTKAIRIVKISPSFYCEGQQSNPVVFEWKVFGTPSCK